MRSLGLFLFGKSVILPLHMNYIYIFIDMFVHNIMVYVLICSILLYNIIIGCA